MAAAKAALRAEALARRRAAAARPEATEALARATATLDGILARHPGRVLAGYMPMRAEIDPRPAMAAHHARGGRVAVPVIPGPAQPLDFREWQPDGALVPGPFGAPVPASGAWLTPGVLIVPLLAFDRRGFRLGYGGGYYDRTLAALRARGPVLAIGFAWAAQECPAVPVEPTDARLDLIVTEAGPLGPF